MLTLKDLIVHMKEYKDTVFILGPDAINSNVNMKDMQEILNMKNLKRDPENFWSFYKNHIFKDPDTNVPNETYKFIKTLKDKGLVKTIINQNMDGLMTHYYGSKDIIDVHGNALSYSCQNKDCKYQYDYKIMKDSKYKCGVCQSAIRPDIILFNENYKDEDYIKMQEDIVASHTLFLIGFDYNESMITDLIAQFGDIKTLENADKDNSRFLVTIQKPEIDVNLDDIAWFEFVVKDNIENALNRFLEEFDK